jgi:hypothetical protein
MQTSTPKPKRRYILTTRFTTETLATNRAAAAKMGAQCLYSAPAPIDATIPPNAVVFVIEMDNSANNIAGIGMLRNSGAHNRYTIYEDSRYNAFTYTGPYRIARADLSADEMVTFRVLETLCMTGAYHMKRLAGITRFPDDALRWCARAARVDVAEEVAAMFRRRAQAGPLAGPTLPAKAPALAPAPAASP